MNPYNMMREQLVSAGLQRYFEVTKYMPPSRYPRLLREDELDPRAFQEAVLSVVMNASEIQQTQQDTDDGPMLFDEALIKAAKEELDECQLRGLEEAVEAEAPMSPELIATYKLSHETVDRPGRFTFLMKDEVFEGGHKVLKAVLFPEEFDILAEDAEASEDFTIRTLGVLTDVVRILEFVNDRA
jgi:hypothetical protein